MELYNVLLILLVLSKTTWCKTYPYVLPTACPRSTATDAAQFFNVATMRCDPCSDRISQEQSTDGYSCVCKPGYYFTKNFGGNEVTCGACPANQATSQDGWSCVACANTYNSITRDCNTCVERNVAAERNTNGTLIQASSVDQRVCYACIKSTLPTSDGSRCVRCNQILAMLRFGAAADALDCTCAAGTLTGGICFPPASASVVPAASSTLYEISTVDYPASAKVESAFFADNIRSTIGLCSPTYNNVTACQVLGNMCALLLFSLANQRSASADACAAYLDLKSKQRSLTGFADWPTHMPWLYYITEGTVAVLTDEKLTTQFTRSSTLALRLASYTLNGTFLGYKSATGGLLQLCKNSPQEMDAAYNFGTSYSQSCSIAVDSLKDSTEYPLTFYDIYIEFEANGVKTLYPVPVRVLNLLSQSNTFINTLSSRSSWTLVRRFFLVDNVATRTKRTSTVSGTTVVTLSDPEFVRYAKRITLTITAQSDQTEGKIYPPLLTIDYGNVKKEEYGLGKTVTVEFAVVYESAIDKFSYDLSFGILCAMGAIYAIIRTWAWSKRAGLVSVEIVPVVKMLAFACGAIANMILLVVYGISFYFLVFYKNQVIFTVFIPTSAQEYTMSIWIAVAFVLKIFDIVHIIASQCTIDIFFIDWERPKKLTVAGKEGHSHGYGDTDEHGCDDSTEHVSIWRTYFAANEWNEIQTYRKTTPLMTFFVVLLFMEVIGFSNIASADVQGSIYRSAGYQAASSRLFRLAIIVTIFIVIGVIQWAFNLLIYEKFFEDKLRNYVDLCSVCNVSVFVMAHRQFGYYIHGQSVHGTSDVGLRKMYEHLNKEKENMCSKRGLGIDSDQQTFMMALPRDMRDTFDRLYAPFAEGKNVDKGLETYRALNKFLSAFISRQDVEKMKYHIIERKLLEDIIDCEFADSSFEGHFYKDDGNSFGDVLFYGNEFSLFIFDMLLFIFIDMFSQNTVLDAIITWFVQWIIVIIRDSLSENNLARKTLIDERFLI